MQTVKKIAVTLLLFSTLVSAQTTKIPFDEVLFRIKDTFISSQYTIAYEVNLAKALHNVAKAKGEVDVLYKAKALGLCKASHAYNIIKKDPSAVVSCPMRIVLYQQTPQSDTIITYLPSKMNLAEEINRLIQESLN